MLASARLFSVNKVLGCYPSFAKPLVVAFWFLARRSPKTMSWRFVIIRTRVPFCFSEPLGRSSVYSIIQICMLTRPWRWFNGPTVIWRWSQDCTLIHFATSHCCWYQTANILFFLCHEAFSYYIRRSCMLCWSIRQRCRDWWQIAWGRCDLLESSPGWNRNECRSYAETSIGFTSCCADWSAANGKSHYGWRETSLNLFSISLDPFSSNRESHQVLLFSPLHFLLPPTVVLFSPRHFLLRPTAVAVERILVLIQLAVTFAPLDLLRMTVW